MTADSTVVVTGIGVMSPLGCTPRSLWQHVVAGQSAARPWPDLASEGYRASTACRIDDLDVPPLRRGRALALAAARQAVANAGLEVPPDTGVFVGSTLGESYAFEQAAEGAELDVHDFMVDSFVEAIRGELGAAGPARAVATACAAGNYAVGVAASAIRRGRIRTAIAGGVEPFSRLAMVGFSRSRAMAAEACRPFDRRRTGMLLGEGAALFVLERADDATRRGATPLAEVAALGLSCDAYHAVIPRPDGNGMLGAMRSALSLAGVAATELDWINVHGSGTRPSDAAEGRAIRALFGEADIPPVSGSKGAIGHALGAASALELAICIEGILASVVPPTAGHEEADEECGVACTSRPVARPLRWVMNNAFAFGGINSALLLRACESQGDPRHPRDEIVSRETRSHCLLK
jgi:3-oxoacyl-[acyl-carrier-protein] synthase II